MAITHRSELRWKIAEIPGPEWPYVFVFGPHCGVACSAPRALGGGTVATFTLQMAAKSVLACSEITWASLSLRLLSVLHHHGLVVEDLSVEISPSFSLFPVIRPSVSRFLCPSVRPSVHLSVFLSVHLSAGSSVYQSICPSLRLSVQLSFCLCVCWLMLRARLHWRSRSVARSSWRTPAARGKALLLDNVDVKHEANWSHLLESVSAIFGLANAKSTPALQEESCLTKDAEISRWICGHFRSWRCSLVS